jgi:hypothetical protein
MEGGRMRDKISEIIRHTARIDECADQILALLTSLEGIKVVEKCPYCGGKTCPCNRCNNQGTITRQAEWGDIEACGIRVNSILKDFVNTHYLLTKSGGRLSIREKD